MKQRIVLLASLVLVAVIVAGCGGGGGGGTAPTSSFVLSGTITEVHTGSPVSGVKVTIQGVSGTSNSSGKFSVVLASPPTQQTYFLDLTNARPACYTWWAKVGGVAYDLAAGGISMPVAPKTGINVGTISAWDAETTPPPPVYRPS